MYPDTVHLKDGRGRNINIALDAGLNLTDYLLTAVCNYLNHEKKDPMTNVYQFLLILLYRG